MSHKALDHRADMHSIRLTDYIKSIMVAHLIEHRIRREMRYKYSVQICLFDQTYILSQAVSGYSQSSDRVKVKIPHETKRKGYIIDMKNLAKNFGGPKPKPSLFCAYYPVVRIFYSQYEII